ncbi:MAG TPA: calcium-binding protein [Paracoccus sp.]|nr:type I secretion protein [Paracoccus sp. (in: a-proteobacteria)]HIC64819.1 calcium-binding protein [Paracoccus sp. (in: a-proteobacteria)]
MPDEGDSAGSETDGFISDVSSLPADLAPEAGADPAVSAGTGAVAGDPGDPGTAEETPEQILAAIIGTDRADALMGGDGADSIDGLGGSDDLRGGLGDDTIRGGSGQDWIQGDAAYGPGGNDEIHGGSGDDSLAGQGGDDLIWGDEGDDTILGGAGSDSLFGGAGNDWMSGNDGDDVLVSGGGSDDLDGGAGNDLLIGGDDDETAWIHGGDGEDTLVPGAGDFAEGNAGADQFVLKPVDGDLPTIADFDGTEDRIILHLPEDMTQGAQIQLVQHDDGTTLINVNGDAVARMLQLGGLRVEDIGIVPIRA